MKLELLNESDMTKIAIRKACWSKIDIKVDEYQDKISSEVFDKVENELGYTRTDMYKSQKKFDSLRIRYCEFKDSFMWLILGIMFSLCPLAWFSLPTRNYDFQVFALLVITTLVSLTSIYSGVKGIIIRRKIKKNFEQVGVKCEV